MPNTNRQRKEQKVYPYLLKKMSINEPDQLRCSEITYIRLTLGFMYLATVMYWARSYEPYCEVSVITDDDLRVNSLKSALCRHKRS